MSAADDSPSSAAPNRKARELAAQSQLDFDIGFFGALLEREPNYLDVLRCQGELLTRKGAHKRALEIDRRLASLIPSDPVVHYNLACSLAQVGLLEQSLASLGKAFRLGYDDFEHLEADTDLESLRSLPEFQRLIEASRSQSTRHD